MMSNLCKVELFVALESLETLTSFINSETKKNVLGGKFGRNYDSTFDDV